MHTEKADSAPSTEAQLDEASKGPFAVTLDPDEDPINLSSWRKWWIEAVLACGGHTTG